MKRWSWLHDAHCAATACCAAGTEAFWACSAASVCAAAPVVPRVSAPQPGVGVTPWVSGTRFATLVNGVRSGVEVNADAIGVAAASFWFSGCAPRICSIVRTIVSCE